MDNKRFLLTAAVVAGMCLTVRAEEFDHSLYDGLLRAYVNADGLVNYAGLRADSQPDLKNYLKQLAQADLRKRPDEEKAPFWINAYNAHVIQQVLDRPEMRKISEQKALFDALLLVAKGSYSLNDIEHRILRGKTDPATGHGPIPGVTLKVFDPRLHFALVCGAVDCPKLRNFAYTARNLENTLRENSTAFANSPKHVSVKAGRLRISSLMNWYAEDFETLGGPASYLSRLINPDLRPDAAEVKKRLLTEYTHADFVYDWTVNDIGLAPTQRPALLRAPK